MEDFPRGGSNGLSPLDVQKIREDAKQDFLFGKGITNEISMKKAKKKTERKTDTKKSVLECTLNETSGIESRPPIQALHYKALTEKQLLLGRVKEINRKYILVNLPNSLIGFIENTAIESSHESDLDEDDIESQKEGDSEVPSAGVIRQIGDGLRPRSLVPLSVSKIDLNKMGFKQVQLSTDPRDINSGLPGSCCLPGTVIWGKVIEVEDHGYSISFGIKDVSGFLPKSQTKDNLKLHELLWFSVTKASGNGRLLNVTNIRENVQGAIIKEDAKLSFSAIRPGVPVNTTVVQVTPRGAYLKFSSFEATVDCYHYPNNGADEATILKVKQKVTGRIIQVNPFTKSIGISLLESVVKFQDSTLKEDDYLGLVKECLIVNNRSKPLLSIDENMHGTAAMTTVNDRKEVRDKVYKKGSKKRGRIVGFNSMDQLFVVSFAKSVIEQPFLRYRDFKLGQTVEGHIITVESFGMLVQLADHIRGLVPTLHLADITLKHPEKKLIDGKKVVCKVLTVNPQKNKLLLTHKRTLIQSEHDPLTSYEDAKIGVITHGYIVSVKNYGLIVKFYGDVSGLIRRQNLGILKSENLEQNFTKGQVVRCQILSSIPHEKKISLKLLVGKETASLPKVYQVGETLVAKIAKKEQNGILVQPSNSDDYGWIPDYHTADSKSNFDAFMSVQHLPPGTEIGEMMYWGKDKQNRNVFTMKRILHYTRKNITFEDLKVGKTMVGIISHLVPYGCFVEIVPGLNGLVPVAHLADTFISLPSASFHVGQCVIAKVTEIDLEKKRFLLTMKQSLVMEELTGESWKRIQGTNLLEIVLQEKKRILRLATLMQEDSENLFLKTAFALVGNVVAVKVIKSLADGFHVLTGDDLEGEIPKELATGVITEVGESLPCYIVDVDLEKRKFIAVADPEIIEKRKNAKAPKLKVGDDSEAVICWVTNCYVVALLIGKNDVNIGYVAVKQHLNSTTKASSKFAIGQKLRLKIDRITDDMILLKCVGDMYKKKFDIGDVLEVSVISVQDIQLNVTVKGTKIHGRVHISESADDLKEGTRPLQKYKSGDNLRAKVIGFRDMKTHKYLPISHQTGTKALLELSLRRSVLESKDISEIQKPKTSMDYKVTDTVIGFVKTVLPKGILMTIAPQIIGFLPILSCSDKEKVLVNVNKHFHDGEAYSCTVTKVPEKEGQLELSRIGNLEKLLKKGKTVFAKVVKVFKDSGLLVELPGHKCGFVHLTNISDTYKEKPLEDFSVGKIVRSTILSVKDNERFDISLRSSRVNSKKAEGSIDKELRSLDDLKEGDILRGYVKSASNVGVFVSLSASVVGRVQIKDLSQYFVKDWKPYFPNGKLVTVKVKAITPTNNHIELSCRGTDTGVPDPIPAPKRKRKMSETLSAKVGKYDLDSDGDEKQKKNKEPESDNDDEIQVDDSATPPDLKISSSFGWSHQADEEDDHKMEVDEADVTDKVSAKATKRQKRAQRKAEEESVYKAEMALLDTERGPENAEDFDRLVLSSPNSSILWIQYMAFHLHSAEIEKARSVVQRALKTISFREEQEKLNVWVAWMNMENMYGTQETINEVFQDAVRHNDAKKVYMQLANIYIRTKKFEQVEKLYQTMLKRFSSSKKVWIAFTAFLMKTGKTDNARKLLDKALKTIPKHKHIETILKFANMEFKDGEPERGKTIFESLVKTYPKRTDIWAIYTDMLVKQNEYDGARRIFERVTALNLSSKKMKSLFKRYLDFEKKYGDQSKVERVKLKALEYVENRMADS